MSELASSLWDRARDAMAAARHVLPVSPDSAASRAYYAAFYAVSAWFALRGRTFRRHTAVEAAVHRDLVKTGVLPAELGKAYSRLLEMRSTGDYGETERVAPEDAAKAVSVAHDLLAAVAKTDPGAFPGLDEP